MTAFNKALEIIAAADPLHYKKISSDLEGMDADFFRKADDFTDRYVKHLAKHNKTLEYGVNCYLKMVADFRNETVEFFRSGEYSSKSFDEVNNRVYNNPEIMEYHMNGLLLSQFLWGHHYTILNYFVDTLPQYIGRINHYLEIGGGHGLYISEAVRLLGNDIKYDLIDISATSIDISRSLLENDLIHYRLTDIFDIGSEEDGKYDFITMGEVLEHVEDPVSLLKRPLTCSQIPGLCLSQHLPMRLL